MFRMVQSSHAGAAKRYYDDGLAKEDYYAGGRSGPEEAVEPSRWGGRGAAMLGLDGAVDREAFQNLCENRLPDGSAALTQRTKANRRVGYDLNFHCPKGVSVLHALSGDPEVLSAFRAAVQGTMEDLEAEARTRVRVGGGRGDRQTGNLVWAEFIHTTTRPVNGIPDPHLHAHCFVFNATFDREEQRWKAAEFAELKRTAGFYEALFHSRLAAGIAACGYQVEPKGRFWDVHGVPTTVVEKFSRRTAEIEELAARKGISDPDAKAELGARTRRAKSESASWTAVRENWRRRVTAEEVHALGRLKGTPPPPPTLDAARDALTAARHATFDRAAWVDERALLGAGLRHGLGRVAVSDLRTALGELGLIREERRGKTMLGEQAAVEREVDVVGFARAGRGACMPLGGSGYMSAPAHDVKPKQDSVELALRSLDQVTFISVPRGTQGKEAVDRLSVQVRASGASVVESQARKTAPRAGQAECPLESLSDRLRAEGHGRSTVAVVTGAHDLCGRELFDLFRAVRGADARLVLAAEAGCRLSDAMERLRDVAGVRSEGARSMHRVGADERAAVRAIHEGRAKEGSMRLGRLGALIATEQHELAARVASTYATDLAQKRRPLIVGADRDGAITRAVRGELRSRRLLGRERDFSQLKRVDLSEDQLSNPASFMKGQVVVFYKSAKGFKAGHRYQVLGTDPFGNVLAREGHWVEALPLRHSGRFSVFTPSRIDLGRGDVIRVTATGRTVNESFGPESILSKRQQAIRRENHKLLGVKTSDIRYRVPRGSVHRVAGFTLSGDIKLENGWVLPKDFGHIEYGYCAAEAPKSTARHKSILLVNPTAERSSSLVGRCQGVESVRAFGASTESIGAAITNWSRERSNPLAGVPRVDSHQGTHAPARPSPIEVKEPVRDR